MIQVSHGHICQRYVKVMGPYREDIKAVSSLNKDKNHATYPSFVHSNSCQFIGTHNNLKIPMFIIFKSIIQDNNHSWKI